MAQMRRYEWDLDQEQLDRLRELAPDAIDLFMAGLRGMSAQFQAVLTEMRAQIDALQMENRLLHDDVESLRREIAGYRTMAVMIQAVLERKK